MRFLCLQRGLAWGVRAEMGLLVLIGAAVLFAYALHYRRLPSEAQAAAAYALPRRRTLARSPRFAGLVTRLLPSPCAAEHATGRLPLDAVDESALRGSALARYREAHALAKRVVDILMASALLLFTAPVLIGAAIAVRLSGPGPIFYRQVRVGHAGRTFTLLKFRSMRVDAEARGAVWARKADDRVTPAGRFLRRTRIDEIPQAFNVLSGAMSFVGPRPERPEFTGLLADAVPHYDARHLVKPGLTGWAQVNYPYGASVEDAANKLEYDLYYVKHFSLVLDLFIVVKTLKVAFDGEGAR